MKLKLLSISVAPILFVLLTETALADWSANFQPPSAEQPAILIDLPDSLDIAILTTLAVELDGIDVTALLSLEGGDLIYIPAKPLPTGPHLVRLLVLKPDGSSDEKAQWPFNLTSQAISENSIAPTEAEKIAKAEAWLKSASFRADTLTEFSYRSVSKNLGDNAPDHAITSGSGNLQGQLEGQNWTVDSRANYFIQSDRDLALTGKTIDIGEYTVNANYTGEQLNTGFTLGHHDTGLDSLLFSQFYRRGLSARVASTSGRVSANAFAFNPRSQAGQKNLTGIAEGSDLVKGFSVSAKPFSASDDALKLTAMYYRGEKELEGSGIGLSDADEVSTGDGWGMMLEKTFADGRIDIRGQYAHSNFDIDGKTGLAPEDSSNAATLLIETRPFNHPTLLGEEVDVVVGAKYERIDTFFRSLGNEGLAADRDAITGYSNLYWGSFSSNFQWVDETNNVDDLAGLPTEKLRDISWDANYAFSTQTESRAWLGSPYLNFSARVSELDRDKTPTGYVGPDTDVTSTSYTFGGGSSYDSLYWSASHTYAEYSDHVDTAADTRSNFTTAGFGWTASERLSINSNLQYSIFEDTDNNTTSYNTNLNLGLIAALIKNKLNLNLNYNLNLAGSDNDSPDRRTLNGELGWTIRPSTINHPGFGLALRGSMETTHGNAAFTQDDRIYQIFTVFRITAATATGH